VTRRPAITLGAWSIVVWVGRLRNIAADDGLDAGTALLPLTFVVGGAIVIAAALRRSPALRPATLALAVWTIAVWLVRGTGILLADHDGGFKAVHMALAGISIGLAALAVRSVVAPLAGRRRVQGSGSGSRHLP
jgi:hypothetical protein